MVLTQWTIRPQSGPDSSPGSRLAAPALADVGVVALVVVQLVIFVLTQRIMDRIEQDYTRYKQLVARYGKVSMEHDPTSFAGLTILHDRQRRALTINMAAVIEAAEEAVVALVPEEAAGSESLVNALPPRARVLPRLSWPPPQPLWLQLSLVPARRLLCS